MSETASGGRTTWGRLGWLAAVVVAATIGLAAGAHADEPKPGPAGTSQIEPGRAPASDPAGAPSLDKAPFAVRNKDGWDPSRIPLTRFQGNALLDEMIRFFLLFFWPVSALVNLLIAPPGFFFPKLWRVPLYLVLGPFGLIDLVRRAIRARIEIAADEARPLAVRRLSWTILGFVAVLLASGLVMAYATRWPDWYYPVLRAHRWVGLALVPLYAAYLIIHLWRTVGGARAVLHGVFTIAVCAGAVYINVNTRLSGEVLLAAVAIILGTASYLRRLEGRSTEGRSRGGLLLNTWMLALLGTGLYIVPQINERVWTNIGNKYYLVHGPIGLLGLPVVAFFFLHHVRRTPKFSSWPARAAAVGIGLPIAGSAIYAGYHKVFSGEIGTYRNQRVFATGTAASLATDVEASPTHEWWNDEMNDVHTCRSCHEDVYSQWQGSCHSLTGKNILYRAVLQRLIDQGRLDETALCQSCHQPTLSALSDRRAATTKAALDADEGVSCKICHLTYRIADPPRNGMRLLREEERIPGTVHAGQPYKAPPDDGIRDDLRIHLKGFSNSKLMGSPQFCASCHRIEVPGHAALAAFALPSPFDGTMEKGATPPPCFECHMSSDSLNAVEVPYPNHKAPGSNTRWSAMLPADTSAEVRAYVAEGDRQTEAWLMGRGGKVDRGIRADRPAFEIGVLLERGPEQTRIAVDVLNARGAHAFPVGSPDLVENWVYLQVSGPEGEIYSSGEIDAAGRLPAEAHRFGLTLLGANGKPLEHHDLLEISGIGDKRLLLPNKPRRELYTLPKDALRYPLSVRAELRYRRASREIVDEFLGKDAPSFPFFRLATSQCRLERPDGVLACEGAPAL